MHSRLTVIDSLHDYHVWPVKYRHWMFEIVESEDHDLWIGTHELRLFVPAFPADKKLVADWHRSMLFAKDIKAHYIAMPAMRTLVRRARGEPGATEVLKFLDWLERNVLQAAANKRKNKGLDAVNAKRGEHAALVHAGPIPAGIAPVRLEVTTLPLTEREHWAREQRGAELPRVFHIEALAPRVHIGQWLHMQCTAAWQACMRMWRGGYPLPTTFAVSLLFALLPGRIGAWLLPYSLDWTHSYVRVYWAAAAMAALSLAAGVWFVLTMSRSLWNRFGERRLQAGALALYVVMLPAAPFIAFGGVERELLEEWRDMVTGRYRPAQVDADVHLGRIVVRGEMKFGSSEALLSVLQRNPALTLVQIESPGGYVLEGLRMAKLVQQRNLDTVVLESCVSSCTLVLAAGQDRYLGPDARMGFHRSGLKYGEVSLGWSATDHQIADWYRARGTAEDFVQRALQRPMQELWQPTHSEMYSAGYATLRWIERKPGY